MACCGGIKKEPCEERGRNMLREKRPRGRAHADAEAAELRRGRTVHEDPDAWVILQRLADNCKEASPTPCLVGVGHNQHARLALDQAFHRAIHWTAIRAAHSTLQIGLKQPASVGSRH